MPSLKLRACKWLFRTSTTELPQPNSHNQTPIISFISLSLLDCWFVCFIYIFDKKGDGWEAPSWLLQAPILGSPIRTPTSSHTLAPIILQQSQPIKVQLYL